MSILWVPLKDVTSICGFSDSCNNNNNDVMATKNSLPLHRLKQGSTEKAELVGKAHRLTLEEGPRYQVTTLVVSWISVVVTLVLGILAVTYSASDQSSAAFAFGLDALLDTLSSAMVIWRFTGNSGSLYSARRERIACTVIGVLFLIACVTIAVRSSLSIAQGIFPEDSGFLWRISFVNGAACTALAVIKFYLGWKLESVSIITDGFNSVINSILGFSTAISVLIFTEHPEVWYLDAACGLVCSAMLLFYGIWVIYSSRKHMGEEEVQLKVPYDNNCN
ncbi:transmembrane protein 163a-like [Liolophura sinensis]|uniref:transmembrane protein 163a-like n=1 Tax=Liolophura sinensis TaxID=3198878 RepID=UPI003158E400